MSNEPQTRHAYLLMAHNRKDLLDLLLSDLDDERNDIFVHIDPRSTELSFEDLKTYRAGLFPVENKPVNWGGYSQVSCEMRLISEAHKHGPYEHYHFLQRAAFPLKTQDELHRFYHEHADEEFIEIDMHGVDWSERLRRFYFFNEHYSPRKSRISFYRIDRGLAKLQKTFGLDRFSRFGLECKKGHSNWSITESFATYLLDHEDTIHKMTRHASLPDEVFIHTMVWNSPFKARLYGLSQDGNSSCMLCHTWPVEEKSPRPRHQFQWEDLDFILSSGKNFARKFDGPDGIRLIEAIIKRR